MVRVAGTLIAASGLFMMVASIALADLDSTFASLPATASAFERSKPIVLDIQAVVGGIGIVFLLWAAWRRSRRVVATGLPLRNTGAGFGLISRYAHWTTATLILALIPMGIFMSVLHNGSPDRAVFSAVHGSLGLTVIALVVVRLARLLASRPPSLPASLKPWERRLAAPVHAGLYALILALPITGLPPAAAAGGDVRWFGRPVPRLVAPHTTSTWAALHDWVLPTIFYGVLFPHVDAVLKHHFVARRSADVRRMLR